MSLNTLYCFLTDTQDLLRQHYYSKNTYFPSPLQNLCSQKTIVCISSACNWHILNFFDQEWIYQLWLLQTINLTVHSCLFFSTESYSLSVSLSKDIESYLVWNSKIPWCLILTESFNAYFVCKFSFLVTAAYEVTQIKDHLAVSVPIFFFNLSVSIVF